MIGHDQRSANQNRTSRSKFFKSETEPNQDHGNCIPNRSLVLSLRWFLTRLIKIMSQKWNKIMRFLIHFFDEKRFKQFRSILLNSAQAILHVENLYVISPRKNDPLSKWSQIPFWFTSLLLKIDPLLLNEFFYEQFRINDVIKLTLNSLFRNKNSGISTKRYLELSQFWWNCSFFYFWIVLTYIPYYFQTWVFSFP